MREPDNTPEHRFLALLRPLECELEAYARRLLWDPGQVRDAVQNAILRAFKACDRYRNRVGLGTKKPATGCGVKRRPIEVPRVGPVGAAARRRAGLGGGA